MVGLIQLALLTLFVAFASGSESCSWPGHHQLAGVGLLQYFQRRHTASSAAASSSTLSQPISAQLSASQLQPAHIVSFGSSESLQGASFHQLSTLSSQPQPLPTLTPREYGASVHKPANRSAQSPSVAPQSATAQLPDAATKIPIAGASQVIQQARSGAKSSAEATKQEVQHKVDATKQEVDHKVTLQLATLQTNHSIMTDLTAQAQRPPKKHDQWSKNIIIDGVCVMIACVILFLFVVLADVI